MLVPRNLTVVELIDTINNLFVAERRKPTVDEVVAEVLARHTASLQILRDSTPLQPPKPVEETPVASQRTSHAYRLRVTARMAYHRIFDRLTSRTGTVFGRNPVASTARVTSRVPNTSPDNLNSSRSGAVLSESDLDAPPKYARSSTSNSTCLGATVSISSTPRASTSTITVATPPHIESVPIVYSKRYYAVIRGRRVGVFPEPYEYIKTLIDGVPNNYQRGFKNKEDATLFYYEQKAKGHVKVIRTSHRDAEVFSPAEVEP